jgi:hypothetical protein
MLKLSFIICFILQFTIAFGQLEFGIGTYWIYSGNQIILEKDTVIDGEMWYGMSELSFCSRSLQDFWLRKDGDIMLMYDPVEQTSNLLYDFSKQQGEEWSINLPDGCPPFVVTVDSVSTALISGVSLRVQHISFDQYNCYDFSSDIYEGIGSSHYLFPTGNLCDGGANGLRCFSTQDQQYIINPNSPCLPTSIKKYLAQIDFNIFPNPVQDKLYFETTNQNWNYEIINLQGQKIMSGTYQDIIDVEQLPSGIYLLQLQQNDEMYQAIKFVKE